jgi:NAD(P)-dependent dehydrogenase (short-subunit alcohol dehydrogenase family)
VTNTNPGTVLITGPTGGLGLATTLAMAHRSGAERPDLLLLGRPGEALAAVGDDVRAAGANAQALGCDLSSLSEVRAAAAKTTELVASGQLRPLRGLIANAGLMVKDTRTASGDGYELTFAVNYLAHAQLIEDLLDSFARPARIVLLGSNTYHANLARKVIGVQPARWRDPIDLAQPAPDDTRPSIKATGIAYSNSKLAILYFAHELQRRAPEGINVSVFEPGVMPGTGLGRHAGPAVARIGRAIQRLPGVASPTKSGPQLASIALDKCWAHLRDGAFVVRDKKQRVKPIANDSERERRLWDDTARLLQTASRASG